MKRLFGVRLGDVLCTYLFLNLRGESKSLACNHLSTLLPIDYIPSYIARCTMPAWMAVANPFLHPPNDLRLLKPTIRIHCVFHDLTRTFNSTLVLHTSMYLPASQRSLPGTTEKERHLLGKPVPLYHLPINQSIHQHVRTGSKGPSHVRAEPGKGCS